MVDGSPWTLADHLGGGESGAGDVVLVFLRGFS
jgi:hypothetical protein